MTTKVLGRVKFDAHSNKALNRENMNQLLNFKNTIIMKNYLIIFFMLSCPLFIFSQNPTNGNADFLQISSGADVLPAITITVFKPVIEVTENYIDLIDLSNSNFISVSVYCNNNKIFNVAYDNQRALNKRFDTSELPKGSYTFNVSSGSTTYSKRFRK